MVQPITISNKAGTKHLLTSMKKLLLQVESNKNKVMGTHLSNLHSAVNVISEKEQKFRRTIYYKAIQINAAGLRSV